MMTTLSTTSDPLLRIQCGGRRTRGYCGKPVVSVITVVFNGAHTIEATILSVLEEKDLEVEYIVVDGGSTDGTVDILRQYDDRITYWISEPDAGIYDAMNKGIRLATADVIGIINADDAYAPRAIDLMWNLIQSKDSVDYCYGWISLRERNGRFISTVRPVPQSHFSRRVLRETPIPHPTVFARRKVYDRLGLFDSTLQLAGDFELIARWHRASLVGHEIHQVIVYFTTGGASTNPLILSERRTVALRYGLNPMLAWIDWAIGTTAMQMRRVFPARVVGLLRSFRCYIVFRK